MTLIRLVTRSICLLTIVLASPYCLLPQYDFPTPNAFTAHSWFNPYKNTDSIGAWYKCNFHAHAKAWSGVTDGRSSMEVVDSVYRSMNYDVASLSNYFSIDTLQTTRSDHTCIPVYEHGYSIQKSHRLVIGARGVNWFDVITPQTTSIKQFIMHRLAPDCDVLALAHPSFGRPSYTLEDAQHLCDYNCMEVLNHYRTSTAHWDAALSAGRPVWIVADDDTHNAMAQSETGVRWTMIHSNTRSREQLCESLKSGRAYGVVGKRGRMDIVPTSISVEGDSLRILCSSPFRRCRFIGQGGAVMEECGNDSVASYKLKSNDTYIRTEIESDSCSIYFNPVIRCDSTPIMPHATVRTTETLLLRLVYVVASSLILYFAFARRGRRI